jgi:hypothetical protein
MSSEMTIFYFQKYYETSDLKFLSVTNNFDPQLFNNLTFKFTSPLLIYMHIILNVLIKYFYDI